MKKQFEYAGVVLSGGLATVALITGCGRSSPPPAELRVAGPIVASDTAVALDLYRALGRTNANLIFSPYGISSALGMLYAGAGGQTRAEIAQALRYPVPREDVHRAYAVLASRLAGCQSANRVRLTAVNSLWCQKDYAFADGFLNTVRDGYRADARLVDFKNQPEAAFAQVNAWLAQKSGKRSTPISVPQESDTRLMICSVVDFKATWATRFDAKATHSEPFYVTPDRTVPVPMMYQQASHWKCVYTDGLSLLELPYAGNQLSMVILLPDILKVIADFESELSATNLHRWLAALDAVAPEEYAVFLPRFKARQCFDLKEALTALGVRSLFSVAEADLSGMTGRRDLYVSDAIQEAFIEVDESGTKAGATTHVRAEGKAKGDVFRANHPFLFLIRENQTGCILFLGRVVDPSA
ncbi:MAG: serpin family protein [Verrucomicrobia bacterium]|nr:serpin family protein [Verrucomicrobiota bacterium]